MAEIYVNITNYPNYQISNLGNVKNIRTGRILKPSEDRYGYLKVNLINNGDISTKTVHKLVANEFLENPENKKCIDHIDHNRKNNNVSNLRVATHSENQQNRSLTNRNTSGVVGVCFDKKSNKWNARIQVNKVNICLGYFVNKEDAVIARTNAEILYFREFRSII